MIENLKLANESDVEQKFIFPLLSDPAFLDLPVDSIHSKEYLAPTSIDKASGKKAGYYPDYSIWMSGLPVMIVEAKDPKVAADVGYREACLYARHLNVRYSSSINPCKIVMSCNGELLLCGYWDQEEPVFSVPVKEINVGSNRLEQLAELCGKDSLNSSVDEYNKHRKNRKGVRPFNIAGGQALINSTKPLNTFAAELSPILKRYFSSNPLDNIREIAKRAYVSSDETTEYDRVLEALLKDRSNPKRDTIVEPIKTNKGHEPKLTKAIENFSRNKHHVGQLQILQGAVGSGKSLFARRYRELLEPDTQKENGYWAFVDFNNSPASLSDGQNWLAQTFIESIAEENPQLDLYASSTLKGIFSTEIMRRRAYYSELGDISEEAEKRARAEDIVKWQEDPIKMTEGLGQYVFGVTQKNLVVVMDNVDKLDLQNQLDAFQLTLWFMHKTRAFVLLQMRDETYERFKNKPPLDTYRTGIAFHISPPRFIDVVKKRLELALEFLSQQSSRNDTYLLDNGAKIILPAGKLGGFLRDLYLLIFGRRGNVSRVLEALAGRDVRRALEMFSSIVTSGHLSTSAITSNVIGGGELKIAEYDIIRILMRTGYRFFSDSSGYMSNIFHYENAWKRPDNFLLVEILYFLSMNRKVTGEIGLEGYFSVDRICDEIQKLGYDRDDIKSAINYLLSRQLVVPDHFNYSAVESSDCVKIQAAGFIHLRILCERIEYLSGIIPVIPFKDNEVASKMAHFVNKESQKGFLSPREKVNMVEILLSYLKVERDSNRSKNPFYNPGRSGADYVIQAIQSSLDNFNRRAATQSNQENQLDLLAR